MYEDKKDLMKSLPRQQDMCRECHVQAAINAPLFSNGCLSIFNMEFCCS